MNDYVKQRLAEIQASQAVPRSRRSISPRMHRRVAAATPNWTALEPGYKPSAPETAPHLRYTKPRILPRVKPNERLHDDLWVPPALAILPLQELFRLPAVNGGARRPGVYFLWLEEKIQYIGSSNNVRNRVGNHDLDRDGVFQFDKATYLPVRWPWYLAVEALYIRHWCPPNNTTFSIRFEKGDG